MLDLLLDELFFLLICDFDSKGAEVHVVYPVFELGSHLLAVSQQLLLDLLLVRADPDGDEALPVLVLDYILEDSSLDSKPINNFKNRLV